jgi:hypothetical protein
MQNSNLEPVVVGGIYQHYKGMRYRVLGHSRHSETLEEFVLYETLYENKLGRVWVRPKIMFSESVTIAGKTQPRFRFVEPNSEFLNTNRIQRISAGAIVVRDGRILLVRHKEENGHDFLVMPGGGAIEGEDAATAAVRETREEAGVECRAIRLAYIEEMHIMGHRECKLWFFCEDIGGTPSSDRHEATREHIVSAGFYSRADLAGRTVYPPIINTDEFWNQLAAGFPQTTYLGLRETGC